MNKADKADRNRKMIPGVQKHMATVATIPVKGAPTPPTAIVKDLQSQIDASDARVAAEAAIHKLVEADKAAATQGDAAFLAVKTWALVMFAGQAEILGDFGLTEPLRHKPTAATLATAADKRRATRAKLHTMGPKQKKAAKAAPPAPPATKPA